MHLIFSALKGARPSRRQTCTPCTSFNVRSFFNVAVNRDSARLINCLGRAAYQTRTTQHPAKKITSVYIRRPFGTTVGRPVAAETIDASDDRQLRATLFSTKRCPSIFLVHPRLKYYPLTSLFFNPPNTEIQIFVLKIATVSNPSKTFSESLAVLNTLPTGSSGFFRFPAVR